MKKIGMLGGMSWQSTLAYYKFINEEVKRRLGGLHSAKIIMSSVDFEEIEKFQHTSNWDATAKILCEEANAIQDAKADFLIICTNTMHKVVPQLEKCINIPILHIADATGEKLNSDGVKKVILLGTKFTMQEDFYKDRLKENYDIDLVVPNNEDQEFIHKVIYEELCVGIIKALNIFFKTGFNDRHIALLAHKVEKNYIGVSGGVEPIFATYYTRRSESFGNKLFKVFHSTIQAYIDINNLGHVNNYNIPYRVFWDYNHERIMNGAYIDKGDWDTFIDKGKQEKVNTCQLTVFKSINTAGPCNTARNQYVDLALEYLYQGTNSLTITDKTNSESNNPLKTEPVFLILQRDLLDSLSHSSPIANAGVDKNVMEGESVLFDASLSTADGGIKSYEWSKEGAILALTPSFTKNNDLLQGNLSVGTHTFTLRITNFFNETSTDTVNINVIGSIVIHNGLEYGAVSSPFTGKIWLDRNLGASQFCISLNDTACYGGYYQWGRSTDGHEQKTSATTSVQAADINNAGSKMVVNWTDWFAADSDGSLRGAKWSEIDGNSICPSGYRVPTVEEFEAEIISNSINNNTNAFNSFLKMPSSGLRNSFDGSFSDLGASSNYWVSSTSGSQSVAINIYSTGTSIFNTYRTQGLAVRCIKSNT